MEENTARKISYVTDASAGNRRLREDKNDPLHWDVLIVHEDGPRLKAHKAILAANSGFFRATFSAEWIENSENEVYLKKADIKLQSLDVVLGSIYSEPFDIDCQNAYDIHLAANFLEMEDLRQNCTLFLQETLSIENALSTWRFSKRDFPGSDVLLAASQLFIDNHFVKVYADGGEFCDLNSAEIKELISRESLGVFCETEVVDAVLIWLNFDWSTRFRDGLDLFELVRWPHVEATKVRKLPSANTLVKVIGQTEAEKLAKLSMVELLWSPQMHVSCAKGEKVERRCQGSRMLVVEVPGNERLSLTDFNLKTGAWGLQKVFMLHGLSDDKDDLRRMKVMFLQRCIVIVTSDGSNLSELRLSALQDGSIMKTLSLAAPAIAASSHFLIDLQLLEETLYVPLYAWEGEGDRIILRSVLMYDLANLEHDFSDEMPFQYHSNIVPIPHSKLVGRPSTIVHPGTGDIYIIGGLDCREVYIFNQNEERWHEGPLTHMTCCNDDAYFFFIESVLYSVGGGFHGEECAGNFEYLPVGSNVEDESKWVKGPDLAQPCLVRCHYVHDGRLYVVGGTGDATNSPSCVQSIDLAGLTGSDWRDDTSLFDGRKPWLVGIV